MTGRSGAPAPTHPAMPSQDTSIRVGIVVAVEEELRAMLKRASPATVESAGELRIHRCRLGGVPAAMLKSGMGAERAERAAKALIERYRPQVLLICGFCGGLAKSLSPGDVTIADRVCFDGESPVFAPDEALLRTAKSICIAKLKSHVGGLVTTAEVVRSPHEKAEIVRQWPEALAV